MMIDNLPEIMTIGEASRYLRVSQSSLYKLAQKGRVPCQKVGRHWRFRRAAIDRWLEQAKALDSSGKNVNANVDQAGVFS